MCLERKYNGKFTGDVAFKVVRQQSSGHLATGICGYSAVNLTRSKFSKEPNPELYIHRAGMKYRRGFHCFTNLKDAIKVMRYLKKDYPHDADSYKVCAVEIKDQVAFGRVDWAFGSMVDREQGQGVSFSTDTVVVQSCKILGEVV